MDAIGVVDYGMGNLHSLSKALERVAGSMRVEVSYDPEKLLKCSRMVLPGVGGASACMRELKRLELDQMIKEAAARMPLLGVCLGMQVLLEWSDENEGVAALGLVKGKVERFPDPPPGDGASPRLKVPHIGWNQVHQDRAHPLWEGVPDDSWFYFVHSYNARCAERLDVLGSSDYTHRFTAALAHENVVGVQFHPEKSQEAGMKLLSNFVHWDGPG